MSRRAPALAAHWLLLGGLLPLLVGAPASAQDRIRISPEPGTPVIATQILIASGPADEPPERSGLANLAARAVTRPIRPALDSLEARLTADVQKDAIAFTLVAAPDVWEQATRVLLVALFRDPVLAGAVEAERAVIQRQLLARRNNPADEVVREADRAFFGEDHPWGRPAVGLPETVASASVADVEGFLREHFTADRAFAAVVGPADPDRARAHLLGYLPATSTVPATRVRVPSAGGSVRREYNSITTWLSVVYPFPDEREAESVRLLAHLVEDDLSFGPTRRSVYDVRTSVIARERGGELRFTVVIPPDEAEPWAERITAAIRRVVDERTLEEGWSGRLRRYRGLRLRMLSTPEERVREIARGLLIGDPGAPFPELNELSPGSIRAAGRSLGTPTVVFLGPFLEER